MEGGPGQTQTEDGGDSDGFHNASGENVEWR
jgi:hypothetical protein